MPRPRTQIPKNPGELLTLAAAIYAKHVALGTASPLKSLEETAEAGPAIAPTTENHAEAERLAKATEKAYRERDKTLPAVQNWVRLSRDLLLPLNAKNPKALGDWGFKVDDTPLAKPAAKAKGAPGA